MCQRAGDVFFQHDVKVSTAKAVGADTAATRRAIWLGPFARVVVGIEGRAAEIDVGIRPFGVERRRQNFVVQRQGGFEQTGRARARFQVADIALGRADGNALPRRAAKNFGQAFHFHHVADASRSAVGFDQSGRSRVQTRNFPGAFDGQLLADGVGRGDTFALAVAAATHAANHSINFVAAAFSVGQPFEQERAGTFAHHKAIGPIAKGTAAGGAEGADFAEFDEDGRAHVTIHAAGDDRVDLVLGQHFDGGVESRKAGGAGRVGDEVGAAQIEQIGHAPRDDIGQFTGHSIFGDGRETLVDDGVPVGDDLPPQIGRQLIESRRGGQGVGVFGENDAVLGGVMQFATHGCAEDHGRAFGG